MSFWKKISLILALGTLSPVLWAQTTIQIETPWVRGTVGQMKATGAFMRITPKTKLRLISATSSVAQVTEIHEMSMDSDVMRMRQVSGLDLPAGRSTELKPGGYHIMLMELKQPLTQGQTVAIDLTFEDEKHTKIQQRVEAPVTALGAGNGPAPHAMQHKH